MRGSAGILARSDVDGWFIAEGGLQAFSVTGRGVGVGGVGGGCVKGGRGGLLAPSWAGWYDLLAGTEIKSKAYKYSVVADISVEIPAFWC